jgi:hypothetical protein
VLRGAGLAKRERGLGLNFDKRLRPEFSIAAQSRWRADASAEISSLGKNHKVSSPRQ